jgi:hypothetical protein
MRTRATAELAGLTVLHLEKDFDLIAEITGQPVIMSVTHARAGGLVDQDLPPAVVYAARLV